MQEQPTPAPPPALPAALWLRVSTTEQDSSNQLPDLLAFAAHRGYAETARYDLDDSAWKNGDGSPAYKAMLAQALADAHAGKFKVLVVWALDRLTRSGAEHALRTLRQFRERGVTVVSVQEDWLNGSPEIQDVLVSFAAWAAKQESDRKSERIKAALAKRRAEGKPVGRQPGAADRKPRRRSGYVAAWEDGGSRRAALARPGQRAGAA
jgi:DNA invertase Pin-like site-specific DNA recombinase